MKTAPLVCLLLLLISSVPYAQAQVNIAPGSEFTLTQNPANGGSATDNGNILFTLVSNFSTSAKTIKAEVSGGLSIGTGEARSQIFYEFDVGESPGTTNNTVGAWISYSVDWQGFQLILSTLGSNASVNVDLILRDMTEGRNLHVEPIHALDLKTHSYKIITAGFDHNDSGTKVNTFPAVLKRGHTYRLTLRLSSTLFVIIPSASLSICDYMDGLAGGGDGGVQLNSLYVKAGLDEKEILQRLDSFQNHRHIYLTGIGAGHNNTQAASSTPMVERVPEGSSAPRAQDTGVEPGSNQDLIEKPQP
jgi:hypothetical protein